MHYEERYGSIYAVEDGEILFEILEPAVFMDKDSGVIFKIGDKGIVKETFETDCAKAAGTGLSDNWIWLDLPKDVDLLNKALNNTGYLLHYLKKEGVL